MHRGSLKDDMRTVLLLTVLAAMVSMLLFLPEVLLGQNCLACYDPCLFENSSGLDPSNDSAKSSMS